MTQEANAQADDRIPRCSGYGPDVLDRTFGPLELEHDQDAFFRHRPVNRYWKGSAAEELPTEHGARYVSGLTIYDEMFARGRLIGRYRSAHATARTRSTIAWMHSSHSSWASVRWRPSTWSSMASRSTLAGHGRQRAKRG